MSINGLEHFVPIVILDFMKSKHKYYLTGSRYFGGVHSESDWDFIVHANSDVMEELTSWGFLELSHPEYSDPTVTKVMYIHCDINGKKTTIDVQLVKEINIKLFIQKFLKNHWTYHGMPCDKSQRKQAWNLAYDMVRAMPWGEDFIREYMEIQKA